jgi:hypothetical protein
MSKQIMPAAGRRDTPPNLSVAIVSNLTAEMITQEIQDACDTAELVISLGNVDLEALAAGLHPNKAALCVLGSDDLPQRPPAPFRALHGNGRLYKGWTIAGLSGANRRQTSSGGGTYVSEAEAATLLHKLPPADIILSHTPPAYLPEAAGSSHDRGLEAVADYIDAALPAYCLFASPLPNEVSAFQWEDDEAATLVVGVNGLYVPPPLVYFY